jgi:SNF2 family DNA or RNA helicase
MMQLLSLSRAIRLHCRRSRTGFLDVWGKTDSGRSVDPDTLRTVIFGWHALTYYGTELESRIAGGEHVLSVSLYEAMHYFVTARPLRHLKLEASPEWEAMRRLAPLLWNALEQGRYKPDMDSWQRGRAGWKWIPDGDPLWTQADTLAAAIGLRSADEMLAPLLQQLSERDYAVYEALREIESLLNRSAGEASEPEAARDHQYADEEDWLETIGWQTNTSPFVIALRLAEPAEPGVSGWPLWIVLQDRADPERVVVCSNELTPLAGTIPAEWRAQAEEQAGIRIRAWLQRVPALAVNPDEPERLKPELTDAEAWAFLTEHSIALVRAGFAVQLPAWWNPSQRVKPRLKARVPAAIGSAAQPVFGLDQIVRFDWRIAIGGAELTPEEFKRLAERQQRLFYMNGRWIQLDPAMIERIRRRMQRLQKNGMPLRDVLSGALAAEGRADGENGNSAIGAGGYSGAAEDAAYDPWEEDDPLETIRLDIELNGHLRRMVQQLKRVGSVPALDVPRAFQGRLRDYQVQGFSWMVFLHRYGLGGCLADDMGLGKTIQWIAYLLYLKQEDRLTGPALIICPTSVLGNWLKELERFAPSIAPYVHHGPHRAKGERFRPAAEEADVVLTSYALAPLDREELRSVRWGALCLDEAQNIKNAYTKQASVIRSLTADHRIALTGTPMENRLTELWSIMDFLNPHYLGSLRSFVREFVHPIERTKDAGKIAQVQRLIQPFILRREKRDPAVKLDLPEKVEAKVYVPLTAEQAALYEQVLDNLFRQLDRLPSMERRGRILAALTRLKQVCDHPALLTGEGRDYADPGRSGKLQRVMEMVEVLREEGDRCLIFTQFVNLGTLLQAAIRKQLDEPALFLHGGVPRKERDRMIQEFQDGRRGVFILSLRAGGTGLNLTAAQHVIHLDRWWNPAVEDQATDRAYRIGQLRDVQVHKMITLGTLEERIDELLERKQGLTRRIVGTGEQWLTEMPDDELQELFALRRDWVDI